MESVSLCLEKLFSWFSQHVLEFYFISSVPVNGIFSKRIRVKLDSEESPALVLRESSHLDAAFSDLVFKILPKQNISTNQQWTICRPKLWCEVLKTKAYLTSETSIPTSDGKPFMNTLSRTSKKFPPIKGIIYNITRKLAWRSTLLNELLVLSSTAQFETRRKLWILSLLRIDFHTYQTPTDLRGRQRLNS